MEFNIPGTTTNYVNLNESRLHVKIQLGKSDGKHVQLSDKVNFICVWNFPSLLKHGRVRIIVQGANCFVPT